MLTSIIYSTLMRKYATQLCYIASNHVYPFAVPNASFLPLPPSVAPILNDVNEAAGFALVRVELGGAILTSAFEVTVQTITGGSATGNKTCSVMYEVRSQYYSTSSQFPFFSWS